MNNTRPRPQSVRRPTSDLRQCALFKSDFAPSNKLDPPPRHIIRETRFIIFHHLGGQLPVSRVEQEYPIGVI